MAKTGFEKFAEKSNPIGRVAIQRPAAGARQERELPEHAGVSAPEAEAPEKQKPAVVAEAAAVASEAQAPSQPRRGRPKRGEAPRKDNYQMHILVDAATKERLEEEMRRRHMKSVTSVIMMAVYEFLDKE